MPLCYCRLSKIVLLVYVTFIHHQEATAAISRNNWDYSRPLLVRASRDWQWRQSCLLAAQEILHAGVEDHLLESCCCCFF